MNGYLVYPFSLGLVALLNPCGFPLLIGYLDYLVARPEEGEGSWSEALGRALMAGAGATLGFLAVFLPIGLGYAAGIGALYGGAASFARWVGLGMGLLFVAVGLSSLAGRKVGINFPWLRGPSRKGPLGAVGLGVAYGLTSLGCSLPLFLAGVAEVAIRTSLPRAAELVAAYGLGMGIMATAVAVAIGGGAGRLLRRMRRTGQLLTRLSGLIAVAVGAYVSAYWATDIFSPGGAIWASSWVDWLSSHLSSLIATHVFAWGLLAGGAVVVALFVTGVAGSVSRGKEEHR